MLGKPLQFKPGTAFSYSNFGYDLVGTIIAKASGLPYETAARQLLANAGVTRMQIGVNTRADRRPGEVVYHLHPSITAGGSSWFEPRPFNFDLPYAWPVTLYAADGGWLISAIDYARFVAAIDGDPNEPSLNSDGSVTAQIRVPALEASSARFFRLRVSRKLQ